jgi:hypothetical protein
MIFALERTEPRRSRFTLRLFGVTSTIVRTLAVRLVPSSHPFAAKTQQRHSPMTSVPTPRRARVLSGSFRRSAVAAVLFLGIATSSAARAQTVLYDLRGDSDGDWLGGSLAAFTDANGDGVPDFLVGIPRDASPLFHSGRVRLISGADGSVLLNVTGETVEEQFGTAVADAGDVDHDGVHDILVGIRYWGPTFNNQPGAIRILSGTTGAVLFNIPGTQVASEFGLAIAGLGDVDGDGFPDFAAAAPRQTGVTSGSNTGLVRVISGANGATLYTLTGTQDNEFFGGALAAAGDVDADGLPDLIVGAYGNSQAGDRTGMVRVYRGFDGLVLQTFYGDQPVMVLGTSVSGAGDLNGDGHADLLAGAPNFSAAGLGSVGLVRAYSGADGTQLFEWQGAGATESFGSAVAGGRDLTGDGVPDIVIGCSRHASFNGRVEVYSGSDASLLYRIDGTFTGGELGARVALLGDLDGDGRSEFAAGAPNAPTGGPQSGQLLVWKACTAPHTYCTSKINSLGCYPQTSFAGMPSVSGADDFVVLDSNVINHSNGMMIWSRGPNSTPFAGGTLCLLPPVHRTPITNSGGNPAPAHDCSGVLAFPFTHAYAAAQGLQIGDHVYCQFWSRDVQSADGTHVSLSDGLEFTWCP